MVNATGGGSLMPAVQNAGHKCPLPHMNFAGVGAVP
jgi:hypothetical protein